MFVIPLKITGAKMKKSLIILLFTISFSINTFSQTWERFTTENSNLPINTINNIVIDSNDNLWFHNINSLFMYNQSENKWAEFNESNSNLKKGFTHIEIGKDGSIYVSSDNIYKFNITDMNFEIIEENIKCDKFTYDKNGVLYFVKQFNVYSKIDDKIIEIYNGQVDGPNYPTELLIDENEILWFGTEGFNSAFYKYDGYHLNTLDSIFLENPRIGVKSISMDKKNNIWFGNGDDCIVFSYNKDSEKWIYFDNTNSPLGEEWMYSKDLETDSQNNVWLISSRAVISPPLSLFKYNGTEWLEFSVDKAFDIGTKFELLLLSLAVDSKNNVWIGTDKGLIKFNETTTSVENSTENSISLYPNPANNELTIDLKDEQVISYSISNIKGEKLVKQNETISGLFNIDLQTYASGTYFIELTLTNSQIITKKFVKE